MSEKLKAAGPAPVPAFELSPQPSQTPENNPAIATYTDAANKLQTEIDSLSVMQRVGAGEADLEPILHEKAARVAAKAAIGDLIHVHENAFLPTYTETADKPAEKDPLDKGLYDGDIFQSTESEGTFFTVTQKKVGEENMIALIKESADGKPSQVELLTEKEAVEKLRSKASLLEGGHDREFADETTGLEAARDKVAAALKPKRPVRPRRPRKPADPKPPTPPTPPTPPSPPTPPTPPSPPTPRSPETPPEPPTPPPAPEPTPRTKLRDRLSAALRGNKQSREANAASLGLEAEFYAYQKELDEAYAPQAKALSDFLMPRVDASEVMEKAPLTRFMIDTAIETKMGELSAAAKKEARARATRQAENQGLDLNDEAVKSQIDDAEKSANADLENLPDIMVWRHGSERLRVVAKPTIAKVVDEDGQEHTLVAVAMKTIKNYDRVNQSREDPRAIIRSEAEDDAGRKRKETFTIQFYSLPEDFDASNGLRGLQMSDLARVPMSPTLEWSDQSIHHARGMLYGEVERVSSAIDMVLGRQSAPVPKRDDIPERLALREELLHPEERRSLRRIRTREQLMAAAEIERERQALLDAAELKRAQRELQGDDTAVDLPEPFNDMFRN